MVRDGGMTDFADLVEILAKANESVLKTRLAKILVENFYKTYFYNILLRFYLPFLVYFFSTLRYISVHMSNSDVERITQITESQAEDSELTVEAGMDVWEITNLVVTIVFLAYFAFVESLQIWHRGFEYFMSYSNILEFSSVLIILFLLVNQASSLFSPEHTSVVAAIAVTMLWVEFIYWLRLFS